MNRFDRRFHTQHVGGAKVRRALNLAGRAVGFSRIFRIAARHSGYFFERRSVSWIFAACSPALCAKEWLGS